MIKVEVKETWPEKLNIVDTIAFENFVNGEKLQKEAAILDVHACALLHVINSEAENPEYDVAAFKTDFGVMYTSSETIRDNIMDIIKRVAAEEKDVESFTFRIAPKASNKNKGRQYLTLQLLDISRAGDTNGEGD